MRTKSGLVALVVATLLALPLPAEAAPTPVVTVSPTVGSTDTQFVGGGTGFTPSSAVSVRVLQPDGQEYVGTYTRSRTADASGAFTWAWVWDPGDQLGTYTYVATDVSGASAQVTFTINASGGPPPAEAGSSLMFDAASAPTLATMQAWLASPYRTVGVYVPVAPGTDNRHDKQQVNLTADWVAQVGGLGWSVLPIYLGVQAPKACSSRDFWHLSSDPATARQAGLDAAAYAATSVASLGIPASVPVVYDMEPYATGCSAAIAAFFDGWTAGLHERGRLAGVYGTPSTVMKDVSAHLADPTFHQPDAVWVATDNRSATTGGFTYPPDGAFARHRANQFRLGVSRRYGGVTINIDESAINDGMLHGTPPVAGGSAPKVSARRLRPVTTTAGVSARWTGTAASYDVRTRTGTWRQRLGAWRSTSTTGTSTQARLAAGATWCFQVRARGADGSASAWTSPACTTRPVDDRALRGAHWSRARSKAAYARTVTTTARKGASLRLGRVRAGKVGVLVSGVNRGPLAVVLDGHRIGTVRASRSRASRVVWLPAKKVRSGRLVLTTTSAERVTVDGLVLPSS